MSAQVSSCLMRGSYLSRSFCLNKSRKCNWIYSVRRCGFLTYVCESPNNCHSLQHTFLLLPVEIWLYLDQNLNTKKSENVEVNSVIVVDLEANVMFGGFLFFFFLYFNLFSSHAYECKPVPYWLEKYTSNQRILVTKWHNFNTNKPGVYLI